MQETGRGDVMATYISDALLLPSVMVTEEWEFNCLEVGGYVVGSAMLELWIYIERNKAFTLSSEKWDAPGWDLHWWEKRLIVGSTEEAAEMTSMLVAYISSWRQ